MSDQDKLDQEILAYYREHKSWQQTRKHFYLCVSAVKRAVKRASASEKYHGEHTLSGRTRSTPKHPTLGTPVKRPDIYDEEVTVSLDTIKVTRNPYPCEAFQITQENRALVLRLPVVQELVEIGHWVVAYGGDYYNILSEENFDTRFTKTNQPSSIIPDVDLVD